MAASVESQRRLPSPDQLRKLHARLAENMEHIADARDYCAAYLREIVAVLGSGGGAVWLADAGRLEAVCVAGIGTDVPADFAAAAADVLARGVGRIATDDSLPEAALLLYPVRLGTTALGVVGLLDEATTPPPLRAALQRMLVPLCDHLAEFLQRSSKPADDSERSAAAGLIADYLARVHAPLDLPQTAAAIANETARLVGCDRVSVVRYTRRRAVALAVSGQDYLDRRANLVVRLEALAAAAAAGGEPLAFPHDARRLAPQIDAALQSFLEISQSRSLNVVLLRTPTGDGTQGELLGLIVVEQIAAEPETNPADASHRPADERSGDSPSLLGLLVPHAAAALANSLRYDALPLKFLGGASSAGGKSGDRSRLVTWGIAAGLVAAALRFVPCDFNVEARGTLQPATRRDVFAPADGVVERIFVRHGDRVQAGDPLFELRSAELDVAEADLIKQINETEQEFANAQRQYSDGRSLTAVEQSRLVGQIATLEQRRLGLRRQAALFAEKRTALRIVSPLAGQIATWNVAELLAERPVRQGQTLTSLVDPDGEWEIEVRVPEDRFGHVAQYQHDRKQSAEITFVSAADPSHEYRGQVVETHLAAQQRGDEGNVVLVRAAIDKRQLSQLHPGSEVRVCIECGRRSLGYVLLHDVWSFVQTRVLFKL